MTVDELGLQRGRLVDVLPTPGEPAIPLTLIVGPAGKGKSTLLRQWLRTLPSDSRVLSLSARMGDGVTEAGALWCVLLRALQDTSFGPKIPDGLCKPAECREVFEAWLVSLEEPITIVVDDFEYLADPTVELAVLGALELSPMINAVLSGRRFKILNTPIASARLPIKVINQVDLRFTRTELETLAESEGFPESYVEQLLTHVSGWPLAVALSLDYAREHGELPSAETELPVMLGHYVPDALQQEVLLALALVGSASVADLVAMVQAPAEDVWRAVEALEQTGLASHEWERGNGYYHTHPGLADALRMMAEATYGRARVAKMKRRYAYEAAFLQPRDALFALLSIADYASAEDLVARNMTELAVAADRVLPQLRKLSRSVLSQHPLLLGLRIALERPDSTSSQATLKALTQILYEALTRVHARQDGNLTSVQLGLLVAAERMLGRWDQALTHTYELEKRLAEHDHWPLQGRKSGLPPLYAVASLTGAMLGDFAVARRCSRRAFEVASREGNTVEQARASYQLALLEILSGNQHESQRYLREAMDVLSADKTDFLAMSVHGAELAKALIAIHGSRFDEAKVILEGLEPWVERMEWWVQFILAESQVIHAQEGAEAALRRIRERTKARDPEVPLSPFGFDVLLSQTVDLAVSAGDIATATRLLKSVAPNSTPIRVSAARYHLVKGDPAQAIALLTQVPTTRFVARYSAEIDLLSAVSHFAAGDAPRAYRYLLAARDYLSSTGAASLWSSVPFDTALELVRSAYADGLLDLRDEIESIEESQRLYSPPALSEAEIQVIRTIASSGTVDKAAQELFLSANTVKHHLRNVYRKFGVNSRKQALARAHLLGILD